LVKENKLIANSFAFNRKIQVLSLLYLILRIYWRMTHASFSSRKGASPFFRQHIEIPLDWISIIRNRCCGRATGHGRREWNCGANTAARNSPVFRNIHPHLCELGIGRDAPSASGTCVHL